jgi:Ni,Fe-hydrogenase III large subunit
MIEHPPQATTAAAAACATTAQVAALLKPVLNAQAVPLREIPALNVEDFRQVLIRAPSQHRRIAALFGTRDANGVRLYGVLAGDGEGRLYVLSTLVEGNVFASMTVECPQVHLFERELFEQWGLRPEGHPWLKPVRNGDWRHNPNHVGITDFYRVDGDEVHEVAVGPVHAGVIEPGHFRFQCHGERVLHLEIALGYQHRGVESALLGSSTKRLLPYLETVAGDTTVGHVTAHCQIVEAVSGMRVSARAHVLRAIALELERLANHVGGLGALANDVGFLPTASFCGRLRGDYLNLTALLCGSRFGRGLVRPGGVGFDVDAERIDTLLRRLEATQRDVKNAIELMWETSSVQARFEGTGVLSASTAEALGLVGVAARACGLERDVRHDLPHGIYRMVKIPLSVAQSGDVFARAYVRWLEVQRSYAFVREQLRNLPAGEIRSATQALQPSRLCVSLVEGWRGEVCHVALTDETGRFQAYKLVDPSFHNWMGLAMALRNQQISDFPLCNKSFDLSYCGHDL